MLWFWLGEREVRGKQKKTYGHEDRDNAPWCFIGDKRVGAEDGESEEG